MSARPTVAANRPASADERDRCAGPTCSVVSATSSGESDSETAVQDGKRRSRRSQRTGRIGRGARRDKRLRGQWGDVERGQQGGRHSQCGGLIALLTVMAMFGAKVGEVWVHRTGHVGAGDCLIGCDGRRVFARLIAGRYRRTGWHSHHGARREAGACIGGYSHLREQNHADQRSANAAQEAPAHSWPFRRTRSANITGMPRALTDRSTLVRLRTWNARKFCAGNYSSVVVAARNALRYGGPKP